VPPCSAAKSFVAPFTRKGVSSGAARNPPHKVVGRVLLFIPAA